MDLRYSVEMSIGRDEFLRLLPAAVGPFVIDGDTIWPADGSRRWSLRLMSLASHRAGSMVVPRHRVDIAVEGCTEADAEAFMDRFGRGFLRGGG